MLFSVITLYICLLFLFVHPLVCFICSVVVVCSFIHVFVHCFVCSFSHLLDGLFLFLSFRAYIHFHVLFPQEFQLLFEEARFYQLAPMVKELERWKQDREQRRTSQPCECLVVRVDPWPGREDCHQWGQGPHREIFPETGTSWQSVNAGWNTQDPTHVFRFPLNDGYCRAQLVQVEHCHWAILKQYLMVNWLTHYRSEKLGVSKSF